MNAIHEAAEDQAWAKVLDSEHEAINARREWLHQQLLKSGRTKAVAARVQHANAKPNIHKVKTGNFTTRGIALSGGGIRSAAFCLGALQALEVDGHFTKFDYLSTVSGGGYIGTALTAAMSTNGGKFPFVDDQDKVSDTDTVRHIRDFSNYLIPRGALDFLRDIAIVLRGSGAVVVIILPVVLLLACITLLLNPNRAALEVPPIHFLDFLGLPIFHYKFAWTQTILLLAPFLFAIWALLKSLQRKFSNEFSGWAVNIAVIAMGLFSFAAFLELQPALIAQFATMTQSGPVPSGGQALPPVLLPSSVVFDFLKTRAIAAGTLVTTIFAFARQLLDVAKVAETQTGWKANTASLVSKLILWVGALAVPIFIWIVYLFLVYWGLADVGAQNAPPWFTDSVCWLVGLVGRTCPLPVDPQAIPIAVYGYLFLALIFVVAALCLTPNANSLHGLYRDRLEAAFITTGKDDMPPNSGMKLSELDSEKSPYHIINAALNIQSSRDANRRERNADFFHFSKVYSGSHTSGFSLTSAVEADDKQLTLASAMAISAAAVSSNMGSVSIRALTPTLALLNLRLGYWFRNPLIESKSTNPLFLFKEMFGRLTNADKWLYLTDGGHIENLGVYALLKRRCSFILAVDAEADPQMTFAALAKLERYARIDLGCRINLYWQAVADAHVKATAAGYSTTSGTTGPHCAIGEIIYQDGGKGILLYVKSSLSGDENNYVRDYARRHSTFPDETTGDQFFKEEQFEAYRALGFHATHGIFKSNNPDTVAVPGAPPAILSTSSNKILKAARAALGI